MTEVLTTTMTRTEARDLTDRINEAGTELYRLLVEAHEGRAWEALGYASWREYATSEFSMSQGHAYRLLSYGRLVQALADSGDSPNGEIPKEGPGRELLKVPEPERPGVWQKAVDAASENGKPPTAADVKRARKRREPDPDVPPEFADYDPAADAPDPVEEWARAQAEVDRLTVVVEALQGEGDLQAEVVRLSKLYGQLDGRLRFEVTRANEAEKQATYQGKLLRQVREILGVERNREIVPCLRDLLK